ncbi:MAG: DNA-processing protein DprA [Clostridia bacterium]|nr:DNA-processing protein DprA [Clostridia bacterium]
MGFTDEQLARIWLQCAPMGAWNRLTALRETMGGALGVWRQFTPALYETLGHDIFAILADSRAVRCGPVLRTLEALNAKALFLGDDNYPASLASVDNPPDVLFLRGSLPPLDTPAIAIVGSRRATRYGFSQARRIARELAEKGVTIVSGLARGIDSAGHLGALDAHGRTVAVLGSGVGNLYPPENKELAQRILAEGGAILSELAPDAPPFPYHFPVRNRIISGLSDGVLLVEAQRKSGTHFTVDYALSQGREVFALPGNVDAPGSELPLALLKEGASICTCGEDILCRMGWEEKAPEQNTFLPEAEEEQDPILRALTLEEKTLEELIAETGLSASELGTQLTLLEISGKVERRAGRAYALCR